MQCQQCKSKDKPLSSCKKCHSAIYCSKECQVTAWSTHRNVCGREGFEDFSSRLVRNDHVVHLTGDQYNIQQQVKVALLVVWVDEAFDTIEDGLYKLFWNPSGGDSDRSMSSLTFFSDTLTAGEVKQLVLDAKPAKLKIYKMRAVKLLVGSDSAL